MKTEKKFPLQSQAFEEIVFRLESNDSRKLPDDCVFRFRISFVEFSPKSKVFLSAFLNFSKETDDDLSLFLGSFQNREEALEFSVEVRKKLIDRFGVWLWFWPSVDCVFFEEIRFPEEDAE
ncbi:MAG: hypothetical protein AB7C96_04880 [Hydrogenovibrio sp.]